MSHVSAPADSEDEELLTVPILPFHTGEVKFTEVYIQGEDYDSEENALDLKNLTAEDSSPSSELNADEWLPKMKSGKKRRTALTTAVDFTSTHCVLLCSPQVLCHVPSFAPCVPLFTTSRGKFRSTFRVSTNSRPPPQNNR